MLGLINSNRSAVTAGVRFWLALALLVGRVALSFGKEIRSGLPSDLGSEG